MATPALLLAENGGLGPLKVTYERVVAEKSRKYESTTFPSPPDICPLDICPPPPRHLPPNIWQGTTFSPCQNNFI